jgi:hypothetical protein
MIHGIYVKSKPKNKWHLVSITMTADAANLELETQKKQAIDCGNDDAQVAIQIFESAFWIPEYVNEIKERKALLN